MSNGICFNKVAQLNTLQLLTKLSQRTVGTQVIVQLVQVVQLHTNPGDLQHRNVNDVEINLTPRDQCPAKDAECYKCKKKGHFSSQCLTTTVKEVTSSTEIRSPNEEDLDLAFLSAVVSTDETSWIANIRVNGETMKFKVDTGAEVTAVTVTKLALS